jgi:hypothetical protein
MFRNTVTRTFLAAGVAATLLVPAAQAADRGGAIQLQELDPAIATAIRDRASLGEPQLALDPAIATAIRDRASLAEPQLALDPAIRTALADRESASAPVVMTALADRVAREPTSPTQAATTTGRGFDWNAVGVGTGAGFLVVLLGLGSVVAARRERVRSSSI